MGRGRLERVGSLAPFGSSLLFPLALSGCEQMFVGNSILETVHAPSRAVQIRGRANAATRARDRATITGVTVSAVRPSMPASAELLVASRHARPFEPTGLGSLYPPFAAFLRTISQKRQSEILQLIDRERQSWVEERSTDSLAYQFALSVLADYIAFGNYPLVSNGRCLLVPILESEVIPPEKRRVLAQRLYCIARDRALADRDQLRWLNATTNALSADEYRPDPVISAIRDSPPELRLLEARSSAKTLDPRGLWRAVRTTWSMGVESSAPGREVAFVGVDERYPTVPIGIVQFRNVVPEIVARDRWLGVTAGFDPEGRPVGYLRYLGGSDAVARLNGTRLLLATLLAHINSDGLQEPPTPEHDARVLADLAISKRTLFNSMRRQNDGGARTQLFIVKRAETAADLIRGITAIDAATAAPSVLGAFATDPELLRGLNAGLRKIWHYHMGFVALEMSICGAAPPFGPLRTGKLMASVAGSAEVLDAWGRDRPLGEIATETFRASVRGAVPNPGPLVVFTSGLYPGHSAQYNRLRVGSAMWRKIGDTVGFGSFQVSLETSRLASAFNASVDGYRHITRTFGEGASPRFREVGRAIGRLELPDLLRHEISRPLYALPLVPDPQAVLLGWDAPRLPTTGTTLRDLSLAWWERWVAPSRDRLSRAASEQADLRTELTRILASALNGSPDSR